MPHAEHLKQKPAVEATLTVVAIGTNMLGKAIIARESRGKNNARGALHMRGQLPARGHLFTTFGGVKGLNQRDFGVFERFNAGRKGQLRGDVECPHPVGVHPIITDQVEMGLYTSKPNNIFTLGDRLEGTLPSLGILEQSNDIFGQKYILCGRVQVGDPNLTLQDSLHIVLGKNLFSSG